MANEKKKGNSRKSDIIILIILILLIIGTISLFIGQSNKPTSIDYTEWVEAIDGADGGDADTTDSYIKDINITPVGSDNGMYEVTGTFNNHPSHGNNAYVVIVPTQDLLNDAINDPNISGSNVNVNSIPASSNLWFPILIYVVMPIVLIIILISFLS